MGNYWRFLCFDLYRVFNNGMPSVGEVTHALNMLADTQISQTVYDALIDYYVTGGRLDSIAITRRTTRERQRQLVLKACRLARDVV